MTRGYPHGCFTQHLPSQTCPFCGEEGQVYVGHGETRHCINCVMSWDASEPALAYVGREGITYALEEATVAQKVRSLPKRYRTLVTEGAAELVQAMNADERRERVLAIPDDEWDAALETESEDETL